MRVRPLLLALLVSCADDPAPAGSPATADGGAPPGTTPGQPPGTPPGAPPGSPPGTPPPPNPQEDAYGKVVVADGPVAYWRLGDASGTDAKDEVGNAHPGKLWGGVTLGIDGIKGNKAMKLDGTTGCIYIGDYFRFPGRVAYSAEGWVKISSYGDEGTRIISTEGFPTGIRSGWNLSASYGNTGFPYFDSWNSEGTPNQYVMGAYASTSPADGKLPLDTWNHVAGVFTDEAEEIWVNGVLRNSVRQSTLPHPNQGHMTLGCAGDGSGNVYLGAHGAIAEIAVYDKALTADRIKAHYDAGKP